MFDLTMSFLPMFVLDRPRLGDQQHPNERRQTMQVHVYAGHRQLRQIGGPQRIARPYQYNERALGIIQRQ